MLDIPMRLVVAYGLIAAMLLAAVAVVLCSRHNSRPRRDARARERQAKAYRLREEAAAERAATDN